MEQYLSGMRNFVQSTQFSEIINCDDIKLINDEVFNKEDEIPEIYDGYNHITDDDYEYNHHSNEMDLEGVNSGNKHNHSDNSTIDSLGNLSCFMELVNEKIVNVFDKEASTTISDKSSNKIIKIVPDKNDDDSDLSPHFEKMSCTDSIVTRNPRPNSLLINQLTDTIVSVEMSLTHDNKQIVMEDETQIIPVNPSILDGIKRSFSTESNEGEDDEEPTKKQQ
jgi:hypothetical protein